MPGEQRGEAIAETRQGSYAMVVWRDRQAAQGAGARQQGRLKIHATTFQEVTVLLSRGYR